MKFSREAWICTLLLVLLLGANAAMLAPELSVSRVDLNDNVFHFALIERMVQTIERGGNPLDFWAPEWNMGYPVMRTYQPLSHGLVALGYFALGKSVDLMTVFVWVRYLALVLLPLSFFAAAWLMGFGRWTALAVAALSPLLSTNGLYGLEYNSFVWYGTGLFPQLIGAHFLLWTLGLGCRAVRRGKGLLLVGVLLGLTFLAHLIYGYMGALTLCLMAAIPDAGNPWGRRVRRVVWMGLAAAATAMFQFAPMLRDAATINHSMWEAAWKWDSFGPLAGGLLIVSGKLMDDGRVPVLTLLAFAGAARLYWKRDWLQWFATAGAALWLLLFLGRALWGPVLTLLGVMADMHLHRVIAGAQFFMLLLAGLAVREIWQFAARKWHPAAAVAVLALLLVAPVWERVGYFNKDNTLGLSNWAAYEAARPDLQAAIAQVKARGGRSYAGLAGNWGAKFVVGEVPFYAFLSTSQVPALTFLYHAMALPADVTMRFDQNREAQFRLFNIRNLITPTATVSDWKPFVIPRERIGQVQLFETPGGGYFDVVDVPASAKIDKHDFAGLNLLWLESDWLDKRAYIWMDWDGSAPTNLLRLDAYSKLPPMAGQPQPPGEAHNGRESDEVYETDLDASRDCYALFKMTWHRNWKAYLDGAPAATIMLSPGFLGVPLRTGRHHLLMRYEPGNEKLLLAIAGLLLLIVLGLTERRAMAWHWAGPRRPLGLRHEWWVAGGLAALALPISIPLFTSKVLYGHDSFCYFTRLVEEHQNLTHGIVLPRWAPDFGWGTGQPLFVFHPPMFYWLAEVFHLVGFGYTASVNAVCVLLVLLAGWSMFLLARLYFGETGGWLAAAAYLYAPYFAVDLFVRSALEEFSTFPFLALALFGFGAHARWGNRRYLLLGVAAYAATMFCSFPAALIFSPLLAAFVAFEAWRAGRWKLLWIQASGIAFGLALAVCEWLPALIERHKVWMDRVLDGPVRYSDHLVYFVQLLYSPWGFGLSRPGPHDEMSFALGGAQLLLAAMALIWLERRGAVEKRWVPRFFAVGCVVFCLVMLEQSLWLWDAIPLLQFVELPWRMLGPAMLCLAVLVGALGPVVDGLGARRKWAMGIALGFLIVPGLGHLRPKAFHDVDPRLWTGREMAARGWESTTQGEVTSRWVELTPFYDAVGGEVANGKAQMRQASGPFAWSAEIHAQTESSVRISKAYFPAWEATLDGRPVEVRPAPMTGLLILDVPPGEHRAQVKWRGTDVERWSGWGSLAMLVLWLALFVRRPKKRTA